MSEHQIAFRYWNNKFPCFYVASVKGRVGDWGYTTTPTQAIHLTPNQAQRFAADCRAVGVIAQFRDANIYEA